MSSRSGPSPMPSLIDLLVDGSTAPDDLDVAVACAVDLARRCGCPLQVRLAAANGATGSAAGVPVASTSAPDTHPSAAEAARDRALALGVEAGVDLRWAMPAAAGALSMSVAPAMAHPRPSPPADALTLRMRAPARDEGASKALDGLDRAIRDDPGPILLVPTGRPWPARPAVVAIAWDDSDPVRRAVESVYPLLKGVDAVEVLIASRYAGDHDADASARALCERLAGIVGQASVATIEALDAERLPAALVDHAQRLGAQWLVAGAYGHGVWQERWLGGVSRHLIHRASLPLWLHH